LNDVSFGFSGEFHYIMLSMKPTILVMFGGESAEHEVSVVTGLQALERVPRDRYEPVALYVDKSGVPFLLSGLTNRKQFLTAKREPITFGKDEKGGVVRTSGLMGKKIYPYSALLCFHGGTGEAGPIEGLLESVGIPHTGPSQESAVVTMNKSITRTVLKEGGVPVAPGLHVFSRDIGSDSEAVSRHVAQTIGLPVIVKPAHLGSSIGLAIAKSEVELEKALIEAAHMDSEIVVEKFFTKIVEYNISVRRLNGNIETSEIERPFSKDEILSFADKYERGSKKTGNNAGMASLSREIPAQISQELRNQIIDNAKRAYAAARCTGVVRIDFMVADNTLYLIEPNPIPGSMAFYLWEASGIPFKTQIADAIEEAVRERKESDSRRLDYETDIIEKFVNG
jgi:D-alanine-D-alanine ligase